MLDPDYSTENDIILCKCPFTSKPRMRACVIFYSVQGIPFFPEYAHAIEKILKIVIYDLQSSENKLLTFSLD